MTVRMETTIAGARRSAAEARAAGRTIGLVPTMGALHAGHGALIERARAECGYLAVSIFVNPTQFDRKEDYERYPKALEQDLRFCEERGVDAVFAPEAAEMYPAGAPDAFVEVAGVSEHLCGRYRPGHFRGVATVVAKLFHIVQPDTAYFGEKDAQQVAVIERMVRDLNFPVEIRRVATVRESDGLALSSRNARLSAEERRAAPVLYRGLLAAREAIRGGGGAEDARRAGLRVIGEEPLVRVEYFVVADAGEMRPVEKVEGPVRVAVAAFIGETRLIDNVSS